jgi:hypothetical protein
LHTLDFNARHVDKNVFYAKYMPISHTGSFDRYGQDYNASRVIHDGVFNLADCALSFIGYLTRRSANLLAMFL